MAEAANRWEIDVYYDYLCPWAYRGAEFLRDVREQLGSDALKINWRFFPLEQVNSKEGEDLKLWEQPDDYQSRSMEGFRASLAAQQQGEELFDRFHQLWFRARHGDYRVNGRRPSVVDVAREAGLDVERFEKDLTDRSLLSKIGDDYQVGRKTLGVFGTPTIVFEGGEAAYLKLNPKPSGDEVIATWNDLVETVVDRPFIHEIKRPVPPAE